jgi:hypothetical protein
LLTLKTPLRVLADHKKSRYRIDLNAAWLLQWIAHFFQDAPVTTPRVHSLAQEY